MSVEVFNSMEKLRKRFEKASFFELESNRLEALRYHFQKGGVIQIDSNVGKEWPKLIYPSQKKLLEQIERFSKQHRTFSSQRRSWELNLFKAKSQNTLAHVRKIVDPLFWQHIAKKAVDEQYRKDAEAIDLHSRLISHQKYRPMINAFVNNEEYRKQLTQTVKESIVYKDHKGLARHAEETRKLQMTVSGEQKEKASKKLDINQRQLFVLKELLKWSREQ
jgi:hypothetical protein